MTNFRDSDRLNDPLGSRDTLTTRDPSGFSEPAATPAGRSMRGSGWLWPAIAVAGVILFLVFAFGLGGNRTPTASGPGAPTVTQAPGGTTTAPAPSGNTGSR